MHPMNTCPSGVLRRPQSRQKLVEIEVEKSSFPSLVRVKQVDVSWIRHVLLHELIVDVVQNEGHF
jgi:hypothetical protein